MKRINKMAEKKYNKRDEINRILKILNSSEDHKTLYNTLKTEHKQIHSGDFNPDYLEKEDNSIQAYDKAIDEIVNNYKYDSKLKKYVRKVDPAGGRGMLNPVKKNKGGRGMLNPLKKNKGGMVQKKYVNPVKIVDNRKK